VGGDNRSVAEQHEPALISRPPAPAGHGTDREGGRDLVVERVAFFSDAVFAIAITLLALDLRLPDDVEGTTEGILAALAALAPAFWAFVLSFAVIAAFWIGHVRTMRVVVRTDARFVTLNLLFLATIALLPFPTSVVARQGDVPAGAATYAVFGLVTALLSTVLWVYATGIGRLVSPSITPRLAQVVTYRAASVPVIFALSIPAALVAPLLAWAMWVMIFPLQALITRRFRIEREMEASLGQGRGTLS
jgi:uncharacterized membrane protein